MSLIINDYRETKKTLQELQERLEAMQKDTRLAKELEFEDKLRALMADYSKSLQDIIQIIDPTVNAAPTASTVNKNGAPRRPRKTKRYNNPHTGDVIETKGGNHKELKEWKAKWGNDTVESWMTLLDY